MTDRCVCCGEIIPEGRQVCPLCEEQVIKWHIPLDMFEGGDDDDEKYEG